MPENLISDLAIALLLGLGAQWLAWRFRLPAILLLLGCGIAAGPWLGLIHPDHMLGDLLTPIVSISVALILFEGGMSLRRTELNQVGRTVLNLVSLGAMVTWLLISLAAWALLDVKIGLALLIGAVLIVTGPTVIGPLLRQVRPRGQVGPILKWEGIYIDPIGALLAVLIFEALLAGSIQHAGFIVVKGMVQTVGVGLLVGGIGAAVMVVLIKRQWIPEFLDNPMSLILVIGSFSFSNHLQAESGLFTVTLMGTLLANQKFVSVRHINKFKEDLRVLLISFLFVVLAARLKVEDLAYLNVKSIAFLILLIALIRPLAAWLSTAGKKMSRNERLFIGLIAPRGIVAAAVSSVFALKLADAGYPGSEKLVPITFMVIMGTVFFYGILAYPFARLLGLSQSDPQGILILGAHTWARTLASTLIAEKIPVLMIDTNRSNINSAKLAGVPAYHGNIMNADVQEDLDLGGIGQMMALTPNDGINSLAAIECRELFERSKIFQLTSLSENKTATTQGGTHQHARILFGPDLNFSTIQKMINSDHVIRSTRINKEFTLENYKKMYGDQVRPLIYISESRNVTILTSDMKFALPKTGGTIISLTPPKVLAKADADSPEVKS
jgi:NhaP-type Na+/H+ or K+/H+ antiporter